MIELRVFMAGDADEVSRLIRRDFMEVNIKDYKLEDLQVWYDLYTPDHVLELAEKSYSLVAVEDGVIVGTGSLRDSDTDEGPISAIYVLPDKHGLGIGRMLLNALEQEAVAQKKVKTSVDSSITALDFYLKMGYKDIHGDLFLIENDHYSMEKMLASGDKQ